MTNNYFIKSFLSESATIAEAISNLETSHLKIALVVKKSRVLTGCISDGDIRRGLIEGLNIKSPITEIIHRNVLVVPPDMKRELVLQLMVANKIQQIPVVDSNNSVVGLHLWDDVSKPTVRPNLMLIMAGGKGTRLKPHTEKCPKPLLPIAGKPMLEHIIEHGKREGFKKFVLAIHYLGHMIENYFGNGERLGVEIDYLHELSPMGTAGALSMLKPIPDAPFVISNGDVITDINYGELLDFHTRQAASATMAVRIHEWQHPFGVVQTEGVEIVGFEEKPIARSHINAGVYALDPSALIALTPDSHCDMPTLFERLQTKGKRTVAYPMHEPWLDVGRPVDLQLANGNKLSKAYIEHDD